MLWTAKLLLSSISLLCETDQSNLFFKMYYHYYYLERLCYCIIWTKDWRIE